MGTFNDPTLFKSHNKVAAQRSSCYIKSKMWNVRMCSDSGDPGVQMCLQQWGFQSADTVKLFSLCELDEHLSQSLDRRLSFLQLCMDIICKEAWVKQSQKTMLDGTPIFLLSSMKMASDSVFQYFNFFFKALPFLFIYLKG